METRLRLEKLSSRVERSVRSVATDAASYERVSPERRRPPAPAASSARAPPHQGPGWRPRPQLRDATAVLERRAAPRPPAAPLAGIQRPQPLDRKSPPSRGGSS